MEHFPVDSVIRRVNIEPAIMLGAGRALVLQLAHPSVAQGVEDHSDFKGNPFKRLQGTLEATYAAVFGSADLARGVGARIQWIHEFVVGPGYRANDVPNLLWVHATLCDTALRAYTTLVEPLSASDEETYYEEMTRVAELFGVPRADQPATLRDFRSYMADTLAQIRVTETGVELARYVLDPALPLRLHVPLRPLLALQRRFTLGTLPPEIRDQLGVTWTAHDQRRFDTTERRVRALFRATPRALRTAPNRAAGPLLLWQAERHVRQWDARRRIRTPATPLS
ncbi:MAG: oxygenase MpaB family protein [Microthrixaceae bacterium]